MHRFARVLAGKVESVHENAWSIGGEERWREIKEGMVTGGPTRQVVTHKFITFPRGFELFYANDKPATSNQARGGRDDGTTNISAASSRFYTRGIY